MCSSHQGALPLPLSQPAVSETHAKASGMWDNLLHRRITKLFHYRRTRRPAYERQQIEPTLISINT
jgi:hypothetical protein